MEIEKQIVILKTQIALLTLRKWLSDEKNQEFLKWLDKKLN